MTAKCYRTGKICYATREAAVEAMLAMKSLRKRRDFYGKPYKHRMKKPMQKRAYWCAYCGFFHLTKMAYFPRWLQQREW